MSGQDPGQSGRARGRGRGLFTHPVPFHIKDGHPGVRILIFYFLIYATFSIKISLSKGFNLVSLLNLKIKLLKMIHN